MYQKKRHNYGIESLRVLVFTSSQDLENNYIYYLNTYGAYEDIKQNLKSKLKYTCNLNKHF